jgi:hypothetical protein
MYLKVKINYFESAYKNYFFKQKGALGSSPFFRRRVYRSVSRNNWKFQKITAQKPVKFCPCRFGDRILSSVYAQILLKIIKKSKFY